MVLILGIKPDLTDPLDREAHENCSFNSIKLGFSCRIKVLIKYKKYEARISAISC